MQRRHSRQESMQQGWSVITVLLALVIALASVTEAADQRLRALRADERPSLRELTAAGLGREPITVSDAGRCGTTEPPEESRRLIERDFANYLKASPLDDDRVRVKIIKVVFLVIHDGSEGFVSFSDLENQIDVLNAEYAGSAVQFQLYSAFELDAPELFHFSGGSDEEWTAKTLLDEAGYHAASFLRIYTLLPQDSDGGPLLGYATFPWNLTRYPWVDGVAIDYTTFPGGAPPYDYGTTTTHEVGHWLGLYHTFQGGCRGAGDAVKDTPPEAEPAFGCPEGRDTCAGSGLDPIHNFMDYSDDICLWQFTNGQRVRLKGMVARYRGRLL